MSITKKFLEDLGLTSEQANSIFAERGKEIDSEKEKFEMQIADKDKTITELQETVKGFDGKDKTLEELQKQAETANARVKELEQAEADRQQAQKDAEIEADLKNRFSRAAGENKFKHADIENGRFAAFKQALSDENFKGKGDSEIFAEVTKDMDCFINPQQQTVTMPSGSSSGNIDSLARAREIMGLPNK